jgi:hypothetical protein
MKSTAVKAIAATILGIVLWIVPSPALAQATTTTTVTTISIADNPPAPEILAAIEACVGEPVALSGTINIVAHETDNANGGMDVSAIFTTQNASAVGQTTGTVYRGPAHDITKFNTSGPPPLEFTNLFRISLIGPGQTPKFVLKDQFHITFNANGDITATVNTASMVCK